VSRQGKYSVVKVPGRQRSKAQGEGRIFMVEKYSPFLKRLLPRRRGIEVPGWGEKIFSKKKRNEYFFFETRIFNEASFIINMQPGHNKFQ
jgi:hypothetical protein